MLRRAPAASEAQMAGFAKSRDLPLGRRSHVAQTMEGADLRRRCSPQPLPTVRDADGAAVCRLSANGCFSLTRKIIHPCAIFLGASCRYVFARSRGRPKCPTLTIVQVPVWQRPTRYLREPKCTSEPGHDFRPIQGNQDCLQLCVQAPPRHMHISSLVWPEQYLHGGSANLRQALQRVIRKLRPSVAWESKLSKLLQIRLGLSVPQSFAEC